MTAYERIEAAVGGIRQGRARCPAHDSRSGASLSVKAADGKVLLHCHAGCATDDVLEALGLSAADLFDEPRGQDSAADDWTPAGPAVATYTYADAAGKVVMGVCRTADKQFRQWRPDPSKASGRAWSVKGVRLVLYRLPAVLAAVDAGETVYVAEGEKDVAALEAAGVTATCNAGGAGKWRATYTKTLAGADVVIVADNDPPGIKHARDVAAALDGEAASVRVVRAAEGKDAADHLAAGHGIADLVPLGDDAAAAPAAELRPAVQVARGDGAAILDATEKTYGAYIAWASDHQGVALTLWTAHTHAIDAAETTPYLDISSAEPESGKSRVLEVAELLAARAWMLVEPSEAAMFRKIAKDKPAILLDEYDALWSAKADGREALRALLNVGYRRGATVPRCVGDGGAMTVEDFPVFGAKALAGLSGKLPRTLATRCIPVRMQRRARDETVTRFHFRQASAALEPLHDRLAAWALLVTEDLRAARPDIPAPLSDRQADCWEPLLAIADAAGGKWPARARAAAVALHAAELTAGDPGAGALLLAHIAEIFAAKAAEAPDGQCEELSTSALLWALVSRDDGPWAGWWEKDLADNRPKGPSMRLARMLKPFGVTPGQVWAGGKNTRGYALGSFDDAFARYLPSVSPGFLPSDLPAEKVVRLLDPRSEHVQGQNGQDPDMASDLRPNNLTTFSREETLDGNWPPGSQGELAQQ